jgi:protein TonB
MPEFVGGEKKMFEFIFANLKYPAVARESGISGKVYVRFVVDKSGKVSDATVLRGIGGGCDEEALRVINLMPPWIPAKDGGRPVSVYFFLPVSFTLDATEIKRN